MKTLYFFSILLFSIFFLSCEKDDYPTPTPEPTEIEKLPEATQMGANTVGCLVDGQAFMPSGSLSNSTNPYCGYFYDSFALVFRFVKNEDNITGNGTVSVAVYSSNVILAEDEKYRLALDKHTGFYRITSQNSQSYETDNNNHGELHITKLDKQNNIISGTFWFDAVNLQGEKVEIREGRFDMVFDGWAG